MREVVVWSGEIDLATVWDSHALVFDAIKRPDVTEVVVDLTQVTFMDSMGLSALLSSRNAAADFDVTIKLSGIGHRVAKLFEVTGLSELFDIVELPARAEGTAAPSDHDSTAPLEP